MVLNTRQLSWHSCPFGSELCLKITIVTSFLQTKETKVFLQSTSRMKGCIIVHHEYRL